MRDWEIVGSGELRFRLFEQGVSDLEGGIYQTNQDEEENAIQYVIVDDIAALQHSTVLRVASEYASDSYFQSLSV